MNWYAIYTKPRQEVRAATQLARAGLDVFCPRYAQRRRVGTRYAEAICALFPSYVFAMFTPERHYHTVRYARGVRRIVGEGSTPWPVPGEILALVRERLDDRGLVRLGGDVREGDTVEILDGPFQGVRGIFERETKPADRVIVLLNAIQYQARVTLRRDQLRRVAS